MKYIRIRHNLFALIVILGLSTGLTFEASSAQKTMAGNNAIVAHVENKPITIQEIEDKQINDLRAELHQRLERKLQLSALRELSIKYPEFKLDYQPDISDKVISDFYFNNKLQNRGTFEELKSRIKGLLQMQATAGHYDALYQKAIKKGLIVSYLQKPNEFLVRVPVETAHLWEKGGESVMVLEFSDYQCPFCNRVQSTLKELRKDYKGKVAFGYRHTPLPIHQEADEAAIAAECARDQGFFEKYHEILFDNYQTLNIENIILYAKKIAIPDLQRFKSCLVKEKYRGRIENDQQVATNAGIRGTPGFVIGKYDRKSGFVTGEIVSGAQPTSVFIAAIEKYLRKK